MHIAFTLRDIKVECIIKFNELGEPRGFQSYWNEGVLYISNPKENTFRVVIKEHKAVEVGLNPDVNSSP